MTCDETVGSLLQKKRPAYSTTKKNHKRWIGALLKEIVSEVEQTFSKILASLQIWKKLII